MEEKVFLSDRGVVVSNSRFSHEGQTFAMANVTSVRFARASPFWGVVLTLTGLAVAIFNDHEMAGKTVVGVVIIVIGVLLVLSRESFVVLHTAGGEQRALASHDSDFVNRVIASINQAIISRG